MFKLFESLTNPFPSPEPGQPPKGLLAFCIHYSQGMRKPLMAMSLFTVIVAVLEVMMFGFMGQLVDWLASSDKSTFLEQEGTTLMWMAFTVVIALPVSALLHSLFIHQSLLGNYPMAIRWNAHRYLLKQSLNFYSNEFAGRVSTKVMQTALSVRETVMKLLNVLLFILVSFVSMLILVAAADWRLTVPLLVWLALYVLVQIQFVPKLKAISQAQSNARATMTGRIVDSYSNIQTVKLFAHSQAEANYAREGMDEFLLTVHTQMRLATQLNVCVQTLNYLLAFSVAAIGIWLWLGGAITVGAIAIGVGLALKLSGMSQWVMWEVSALFENIGAVADGASTLAQPHGIVDAPNAPVMQLEHAGIDFIKVLFHYQNGESVIDQLDLNIKAGEKIGLVGRSGAGKSTLVNLLLRFHDVNQGEIHISGQNIAQVQQESLGEHIAMVTQDTSLFHRTVRENILYGRPSASEDEMIAAAKQAEAHEFIQGLSDPFGNTGYDAQVGERGVKLSGGQRQRIAIARVLLKNAPILILDEATSALDSEVEAAIQASLNTLMQGKTVIAIAHRLSTIAAMDRLIVLDKGRIVEQGTHQQLITSEGIYAQLWAHQTGGFLGEL